METATCKYCTKRTRKRLISWVSTSKVHAHPIDHGPRCQEHLDEAMRRRPLVRPGSGWKGRCQPPIDPDLNLHLDHQNQSFTIHQSAERKETHIMSSTNRGAERSPPIITSPRFRTSWRSFMRLRRIAPPLRASTFWTRALGVMTETP